jgi:hypothetical protein|tara:strand:+ start:94 stop:276 length:183 start_codon:yes stop_codon:yes gene_type:complete
MLPVNIDFDEASKAWMKNKVKIGEGSYKYVCGAKCKDGTSCRNPPSRPNGRCGRHARKKI